MHRHARAGNGRSPSPCQTSDMQNELNLVWDHLLPGIKGATLAGNPTADDQLTQRVESLALPLLARWPAQFEHRPMNCQNKTFALEKERRWLSICVLSIPRARMRDDALADAKGRYSVRCRIGQMDRRRGQRPGTPPKLTVCTCCRGKIAASAAWKDDNTIEMIWRYYETPYHDVINVPFQRECGDGGIQECHSRPQ